MFASSGEATDPCGVPTSVFDHSPSSDTPAFSHFRIRRSILRSATRCSTNLTSHWWDRLSKKPRTSASSIQFTFFRMSPTHSASKASCWLRPGRNPLGEPQEILFVNLVEDRHYRLLNDLVLQSCNTQGTLPSISFRNVGSLGRLRSIRPSMDSAMQVYQLLIQVSRVLLPRHAIYSGRSVPLQRVEAAPQQLGRDVVEQRGEPRPLVPTCCFTHTEQVARRAGPAPRPGRGRLPDVLLGRSPSLHALRRWPSTVVRALRRYYATVRLPTDVRVGLLAQGLLQPARHTFHDGRRWGLPVLARGVSIHAWGLRLRGVRRMLAIAHPSVLPSAMRNDVGTPVAIISQLNTQPACAPVNASPTALQLPTHDSGSGWLATPFLCDSFIHNFTPVYPGAPRILRSEDV